MPQPDSTLPLPLCVDLDGTLLRSDSLFEAMFALLRRQPSSLFRFPLWLLRGRAYFKQAISARSPLDVTRLPRNDSLLAWVRAEHAAGRTTVLCTGADARIAQALADHLGFFHRVFSSDGRTNLVGTAKARVLAEAYGPRGFAYAGDSRADLAVWAQAAEAHVVSRSARLVAAAARVCPTVRALPPAHSAGQTGALWRALRPHQWAKNILIAVPLLTSHSLLNPAVLAPTVLVFAAFCLCASSVYLLNDLFDLESDRHHPEKSHRPAASGALGLPLALTASLLLFFVGVALGGLVSPAAAALLVAYVGLSHAYSVHLKTVLLVDVLCLAALYTLRLLAGEAATRIVLSTWLLGFSFFIFSSLALLKRYTELRMLPPDSPSAAGRRGYYRSDCAPVAALGLASGACTPLVLAAYLNSPEAARLYASPRLLWLACPLIFYWVSRLWFFAHRDRMTSDPVLFALRDRVSWLTGCALLLLLTLASLP